MGYLQIADKLINICKTQLKKIKDRENNRDESSETKEAFYFLATVDMLLHMAVDIPRFVTLVGHADIRERLKEASKFLHNQGGTFAALQHAIEKFRTLAEDIKTCK